VFLRAIKLQKSLLFCFFGFLAQCKKTKEQKPLAHKNAKLINISTKGFIQY